MTAHSHPRRTPRPWPRWPRRTARLRLTALYGVLFFVSGAALLASTYVLFERATQVHTPHLPKVPSAPAITPLEQASALPQVVQAYSAGRPSTLPQALIRLLNAQHQLSQAQHRLALLHLKPGVQRNRLAVVVESPRLTRDQRQLTQDQHELARALHQLAQAVHEVAQTGSVQVAQRASDSHRLLVDSGIALAVVGILALLAGWFMAGRMLRPVRTITRTARRISSSSLHQRLALEGPEDELKELGDTLDDLFARLESAFEAQRRFVANASHELRTPLTRERALVQVALGDPATPEVWRAAGEELLASNRGQARLIEALLTLASSEGGLDQRERTDLEDICRTVLPPSGLDTDRLELQVETSIHRAPLEGDPRLLERLAANLVDNAIAHNVAGGRVRITTGASDGKAVITVANTGPVVPATEIDRLFQPFQRLDPRRMHKNGHGLGLSIVRAIAAAHGATITAQPVAGGGLSISVIFPAPADPSGLGARPERRGRDQRQSLAKRTVAKSAETA